MKTATIREFCLRVERRKYVKLKAPWQAAVRKSFEKKKPPEGWPK